MVGPDAPTRNQLSALAALTDPRLFARRFVVGTAGYDVLLFQRDRQPAASLRLHWTDDGLPVGSMLVGRPADDATVLALPAQIEQARPWVDRHPPVWDQDEPAGVADR